MTGGGDQSGWRHLSQLAGNEYTVLHHDQRQFARLGISCGE
jgi:hypothetical protein